MRATISPIWVATSVLPVLDWLSRVVITATAPVGRTMK
jgi:hypothetical protein